MSCIHKESWYLGWADAGPTIRCHGAKAAPLLHVLNAVVGDCRRNLPGDPEKRFRTLRVSTVIETAKIREACNSQEAVDAAEYNSLL